MANTLFIKIPGVTGSGTTPPFNQGEIDLLNFSWNQSNPHVDLSTGTGGSAGKGRYHEFVFTKEWDTASHNLQQLCLSGQEITGDVKITSATGGADKTGKACKYFEIILKEARVSSWTISVTGGEGAMTKPIETFSIAAAEMEETTYKQVKGGADQQVGEVKHKLRSGESE